ncbi:Origin recognition complex subunit 2 [Dinochytrium kinnereticum]|nr:Origin recognition complex subunit 2 [Dinochytrium kinnereticum]
MRYFHDNSIGRKRLRNAAGHPTHISPLTLSEYKDLIAGAKPKHQEQKELLKSLIAMRFSEWQLQLAAGFSLMLYGLGSKRSLLSDFISEHCTQYPVLEINGNDLRFDVEDDFVGPLHTLCAEPSEKTFISLTEQLSDIKSYFTEDMDHFECIYVVIHSIDGSAMRSSACQTLISFVKKSCPQGCIRIIASMDHINAPLLWDQTLTEDFRWLWKDVTSFSDYLEEIEAIPKAMVLDENLKRRAGTDDEALSTQMQERYSSSLLERNYKTQTKELNLTNKKQKKRPIEVQFKMDGMA